MKHNDYEADKFSLTSIEFPEALYKRDASPLVCKILLFCLQQCFFIMFVIFYCFSENIKYIISIVILVHNSTACGRKFNYD